MRRFRTIILVALACLLVFGVAAVAASASHQVTGSDQKAKVSASGSQTVQIGTVTSAKKRTTDVYITNTGEKYHRSWCRYLKYSKHRVTLKSAKRRGYTPCKVCRPPR